MPWQQILGYFVASAISVSGVVAAIAWTIRTVVNRWFDRQVEKFKSQLERETTEHKAALDRESLIHSSQLQREAAEHNIRFQSLHTQRAEATLEIWRKFRKAFAAVASFVSPMQYTVTEGPDPQTEAGKRAGELTKELRQFLSMHAIFFPTKRAEGMESLAKDLETLWFRSWREFKRAKDKGGNPYFEGKNFDQAFDKLNEELKPVQKSLEDDLRRILGVEVEEIGQVASPQETP
jgi:hypothetical protein